MKRLLLLVMAFCNVICIHAQIGKLIKDVGAKTVKNNVNLPDFLENHPITTSLEDAIWAKDLAQNVSNINSANLTTLQRTPNGGFILQPGYFHMQTQSYCLKAGTHGPGGGDGYLYAPPKGPAEDAVMSIVRNSVQHPDIPQRNIQVLLWAIIARAKFEELQTPLKLTAAQLLTKEQLAKLNRNALNFLPAPAMAKLRASAPPAMQAVLEAENSLRQMLNSSGSSFEDMERIAVLAGLAEMGPGSQQVASGQWSLHPDGYYVRYIPSGYSSTRLEIYVPKDATAVGKEFDPATHIAVPGNTSRQRLIQSGREKDVH